MERHFLSRIDVGTPVNGEPEGCFLLYAIEDKFSIVITSRENGDAEIFVSREELKKIDSAISQATK